MKICYICSRYADPDVANRRRNLAEARALARWAEVQGYAVVTWWGSLDPAAPMAEDDPEVRAQALARSGALAAMVGKMGGCVVMAGWYRQTMGMREDVAAYDDGRRHVCPSDVRIISWSDIAPYLDPEPDTIPREAVQAAVDEINEGIERIENNICNGANATVGACGIAAYQDALGALRDHTGVTPSEVTQCEICGGTGMISYNPNLNPNAFPAVTTAKCTRCDGTGVVPSEVK
jgi:hypothetical protein